MVREADKMENECICKVGGPDEVCVYSVYTVCLNIFTVF